MALDGYGSPPPAEQPRFFELADDRQDPSFKNTHSQQSAPESDRSRRFEMPSVNGRDVAYKPAQQPINDAVTSAFDKADTSHGISPELLSQLTSQITANVIQQLKSTNLSPQPNADPSARDHVAASNGATLSRSPSTVSAKDVPRPIYTPPSPTRPSDVSPPSSFSQSRYTHPAHGDRTPDRTSPVSQPSQSPTKEAKKEVEGRPKPGPVRLSFGQDATLVEKAWGTLYDDGGVPTARLGQFLRGIANHLIEDYEPRQSLVVLPSKMQQFYKDAALPHELYPWQLVFDDRTSSISRLYRDIGAAHHLVQEDNKYDERPDIPGLTPAGFQTWALLMLQANPEEEFGRLQKIVRDMPISNADDRKDRFPKEISRRLFPNDRSNAAKQKLEKAMTTHCNISIPPKRSSESEGGHRQGRKTETTVHQVQLPPQISNGIERERQPYSGPSSNASNASNASGAEEEDDVPTPQPIERERKPYSAQPGGGKIYEDLNRPNETSRPQETVKAQESIKSNETNRALDTSKSHDAMKPPPPPTQPPSAAPSDSSRDPHSSRYRANSTTTRRYDSPYLESSSASGASQSRPIQSSSKANGNLPSSYDPPPSSLSTSDSRGHLHPRTGSIHRGRSTRHRSPSTSDPYRRSEPEYLGTLHHHPEPRPEVRERERDPDRGHRDDSQRMSMYEMGTSTSGRERGRYRYEGTSGSISSGIGVSGPPPQAYYQSSAGRDYYSSDDEKRYRSGSIRAPPSLGATPGTAYEYGGSPSNYYR